MVYSKRERDKNITFVAVCIYVYVFIRCSLNENKIDWLKSTFSGVRYLRKAMLGNVLFFPLRILLVLYLRRVQPLLLVKTSENGFDGLLKGYKSKKMCSVFCEQTMTGQCSNAIGWNKQRELVISIRDFFPLLQFYYSNLR